jgi:hypothetical protein
MAEGSLVFAVCSTQVAAQHQPSHSSTPYPGAPFPFVPDQGLKGLIGSWEEEPEVTAPAARVDVHDPPITSP